VGPCHERDAATHSSNTQENFKNHGGFGDASKRGSVCHWKGPSLALSSGGLVEPTLPPIPGHGVAARNATTSTGGQSQIES